jgi:hypothetical protein
MFWGLTTQIRKEVRWMTYQKPEVAVLGDAAHLIQGSKTNSTDTGNPSDPLGVDFEHED